MRHSLLLAAAVVLACGGGGGGGGGGTPPTAPQPGITFTGSQVQPPAVRLAEAPGSGGTVLELAVRADGLSDVYGVAFDLTYPSDLLRFEASAEGDFLGEEGVSTSLQVAENPRGRLIVGYSRLGAAGGVDGSGELVVLRFVATASGSGNFRFSRNQLVGPAGETIPGASWGGGSVRVEL